jgi:hypothetical protein
MSTMAGRSSKSGTPSRQVPASRVSGERAQVWAAGSDVQSAPDRIRARAYEVFKSRGRNGAVGDELSDWLQAEREVNGLAPEPSAAEAVELRGSTRGERLLTSGK